MPLVVMAISPPIFCNNNIKLRENESEEKFCNDCRIGIRSQEILQILRGTVELRIARGIPVIQ
jgi:hypothetical protein